MQIYSISDLQNKPFDDEEIDIVSKSLIYSLIIGMFKQIKSGLSDMIQEMKDKYKLNTSDKIEQLGDKLSLIESFIEVLK